ncbi:MAG: fused MFS/spermidine synthase [Vicinamibacteria bacterium]
MTPRARHVAPLLFGSGLCALVYQIAWLREFRLVFGASTEASAAVLAIFIGGLGLGGYLLGPRADAHPRPLAFYGRLELAIALGAALTPGLLELVRLAYVGLGGSIVLGTTLGTLLRLALAALVLALPTVLMGGTLPAAARAVETDADAGRGGTALLYGVNTLGAVAGSFAATFFLLEAFGTHLSLWLACVVNVAVAATALRLDARSGTPSAERALEASPPPEAAAAAPASAPAGFVLAAAAAVGFAFFLMEMVWYRMLAPLLGGSVFTFGLILALALLGIGLGGAFYAFVAERYLARLSGFAWTCLLEALALAAPFALGDDLAIAAAHLRAFSGFGFGGAVLGWALVGAVVVVPAAFVAGAQFPMLIALLGHGRVAVGRQIGLAYAWNTVGAILGSLAGGFGLLPLLSAPGCWILTAALLVGLGASALALAALRDGWRPALLAPLACAGLVLLLIQAEGPSAAWRHSGIGVGRANAALLQTRQGIRAFVGQERRSLLWQRDGVESSVALVRRLGVAFSVNGKIDGHFTLDAPTQVMSGVLAAALHPQPRLALVIGLGTGSTAGWLGALPGIERVDCVELEPAILEVARVAADVNRRVLENPRVRVLIGDAREVLQTTPQRYDLIFSEPSNPYRAGIASLFTAEFYRAARRRLADGGLFVQWVQGYEIGGDAVKTAYATLLEVFPQVETWRTHRDLLLVASAQPPRHSVPRLRARLAEEAYRAALFAGWRTSGLEGLLSRFVARPGLASAIRLEHTAVNTDDRNLLEFGFARSVGRHGLFDLGEVRDAAARAGEDRPALEGGEVDWEQVGDERRALYAGAGAGETLTDAQAARLEALNLATRGDAAGALAAWRRQERPPLSPAELALVAEGLAVAGDEAALEPIEALRGFAPAEALALLGRLRERQGRADEAAVALAKAFEAHRADPWPRADLMLRAIGAAQRVARAGRERASLLHASLERPFAARAIDEERLIAAWDIASLIDAATCARAVHALEPWVPWERPILERRLACYTAAADPLAARARADLALFLDEEPAPFTRGTGH